MEKKKFLIVEDEAIVAINLANTLRRLGYDVVKTVDTAEAAVLQAKNINPDMILMDIHLKGKMDGLDAAQQIRATTDIPIIFLTAYSDQATLTRALETQTYGYVIKPFQERQLHIAIQVGLNQAQNRNSRENELLQQIEHEKELRKLNSRFVSLVSHEFRTPLTSILISTDFIREYGHRVSPAKRLEHLSRIKQSVKHMTELLEDVLLIGRAEAERLEFDSSPRDIVAFCQALINDLQLNVLSTHKIQFCSDAKRLIVELDERLMRLAITNLLSNAIKYSPTADHVHVVINTISRNMLSLIITDYGIGIPQADQELLFMPFHRAENVGDIDGTGLGLYITKMVVEIHGGQIAVDSKQGQGTSFKIHLPIAVDFEADTNPRCSTVNE